MSRYNRVTRLQATRCTVEDEAAEFCDAPSAPDMPFPICSDHAIALYRRMHEMVTEVRTNYRENLDVLDDVVRGVAIDQYAKANTLHHWVYYIRVGQLIKIGVTSQLGQRIAQYPPDSELLAVEPGGAQVETARHRQFHHLLAHRKEWYRPGPDLMDHITKLSNHHTVGC